MSEAPAELWLRPSAIGDYYRTRFADEPDAVRYVRADVYEALQALNEHVERNYAALLLQRRQEPLGELGKAGFPGRKVSNPR